MSFCVNCGTLIADKSLFCTVCGTAKDASVNLSQSSQSKNYSSSIQSASDKITQKLGLEKIEGFSIKSFFSEVFSKHDPEDIERLLSVGTYETTPKINPSMGMMPNPWIFFRALSISIIAYFIFLFGYIEFSNVKLLPGLIIIGSFAVPFSVLILFFELNTPRNISIVKILNLIVIGGAIGMIISLFLFNFTPLLGIFGASAAGLIEEPSKLAALLYIMRNDKSDRYKYRLNALLLGAAVGTGFAAFESAGYALEYGLNGGANDMLSIIILRGILAPFSHIGWTAITAYGFWLARPKYKDISSTLQSPIFIKYFLIPVALHFIWNLPFEGPFMSKYIILGFIGWVVIISLVQSGLKEIIEINNTNINISNTSDSVII